MTIAELNNKAISNLLSGESIASVVSTLKEAIASLRTASTTANDEGEVTVVVDHGAPIFSVDASVFWQHKCSETVTCIHQVADQFLYKRLFLISEDEQSRELVSAVILYNLAVLSHMRSLQDSSSQQLDSAIRLYLLALQMAKIFCHENGSKQTLLLSLAIANNLGEIYWEQACDLQAAEECFALARKVLKYLDAIEMGATDMVDDEEYAFFSLNVMVRGVGKVIAATAA